MRSIAITGGFVLALALVLSGGAMAATAGDVVINEVYVNSPLTYDAPEYIELYNTTASAIDLAGWVITGTEYDGFCGEHHHQIPSSISIAAHGYIVIARDAKSNDETGNPGFTATFGFAPDLEMYDSGMYYEVDDTSVPNTICQNSDSYDDQIRLIPGTSDYAKSCSGSYNRYEVLYLYDTAAKTNLIDAMEYIDPAYCTADQCAGVNVSDSDAYSGLPGEGLSLGRDASSGDTNNSSADFYIEVATPRAQNSVNTPPEMWTLRYSPCAPSASDSVEVSIYATDPDGIASVYCYYSLNGGAYSNVQMYAAPGDSLYKRKIPPQADGSQMKFYVKATDAYAVPATSVYPEDAPTGAYSYAVGMTLIYDVQYVSIPYDSSTYVGKAVNVTGTVTVGRGVYGDYNFVIQDGSGPWNGIFVYDPTASVPAEEGDSVIVSGKVNEYFNRTELYMFVGCYDELSEGNDLPAPVVTTTASLALTVNKDAEQYEGVLVRVEDVTVTDDSLGYGEWQINDGSGACTVGDLGYYFYTPVLSDALDAVQGILDYTYSDYKIEPRWSEDIIGPPMIFDLVYTPHAPTASNQITFSATVKGSHTITSVKLFYSTNGGASFDSTNMTSPDSVYTAILGPYANGTVVDYYVRATDSQPMSSRKPASGTYDLYVGMVSIYAVQYVVSPADSSAYAGKPVNLAGIVTAATGEYSNNFFFIENHYGAGTAEFKGVKVYDRTGTVSVARGDSVTVSGDVMEYYGETEIGMFFPEAITIHAHNVSVPAAYSTTTASIPAGEKWEGVLVAANNSTVSNPDAGYGEWLITNGTATDTCRVGDAAPYSYVPQLSDAVHVTGIVMYAYSIYTLQPRDDDDICEPGDAGVDGGATLPTRLEMGVRPNPMLDGAEIRFALPATGNVNLKIYNVKGELVKTLASGRTEAGEHTVGWNGTNGRGNRVTSGIYFLRLETQAGSAVSKLVVSK
jgi:hypothetical protein